LGLVGDRSHWIDALVSEAPDYLDKYVMDREALSSNLRSPSGHSGDYRMYPAIRRANFINAAITLWNDWE